MPSRSVRVVIVFSLCAAACAQLDESTPSDGALPGDGAVYGYADGGSGSYYGGGQGASSGNGGSASSGADASILNIDLGSLFGGGGDGGAASGASSGGDGGTATPNDPVCKDQICWDVFDCYIFHPDKVDCGFTACDAFVCK